MTTRNEILKKLRFLFEMYPDYTIEESSTLRKLAAEELDPEPGEPHPTTIEEWWLCKDEARTIMPYTLYKTKPDSNNTSIYKDGIWFIRGESDSTGAQYRAKYKPSTWLLDSFMRPDESPLHIRIVDGKVERIVEPTLLAEQSPSISMECGLALEARIEKAIENFEKNLEELHKELEAHLHGAAHRSWIGNMDGSSDLPLPPNPGNSGIARTVYYDDHGSIIP